MPKEGRKRSRSKSPSSKKSRDRRSPAHERDRDRRDRDRDRDRRDRRRSRSRERRRRDDRKRRSKSDSKSPSPGPNAAAGATTANASSSSAATAASSSSSKSKSRGNSLGPAAPGLNIEGALKFKDEGPLDNEAEQKRLETEMQKRRERIEKWRAEKKARDMGLIPGGSGAVPVVEKKESTPVPKSVKKWNLSDDEEDDDDDATTAAAAAAGEPPSKLKKENGKCEKEGDATIKKEVVKEESEDDIDPLDAYMMGIQKEVRSIGSKAKPTVIKTAVKKSGEVNGAAAAAATAAPTAKPVKMEVDSPEVKKEAEEKSSSPATTSDSTEAGGNGEIKPLLDFKKNKKVVTVVSGVAVKKADGKKKGTLMEQNQDALEYSSEEEDASVETLMENLENKNKKDFKFLDHNKIEYKEFRKDFYIEVPEIANMTTEEVASYRVELEGIKVTGKNAPNPIKTWVQCGISSKELQVIKKMNFEKPTPIQAQAIPCIMSGRDVIGIAKTGSGKTLAFLLPLFRHVLDQPPLEEGDGPIAVVMTPTRELAMQIAKDCRKFCKYLELNVVCVYGGTGISEQIAELKKGAEIIVCTPGRMIDMLAANSGRVTNLTRVTYIVMDEADRMFDLGFEPQVMRIIDNARPDRQIVLFSATFPRQMEALARRLLVRPIEIQVGGRSVVGKDITQTIHITEDDDQKYLKLLELLGLYSEQGAVIIFVDKQEAADELCKTLISASYSSRPLHGGIDQYDRDSTMSDFKSGAVKILIATSVAARGLDVKSLILVVNYDCPNHYEDYVHRCGRTGRAGNKGYAHTFLNADQGKYAGHLTQALELSQSPVPAQLKILWEEYVNSRKAEGKDVSKGGGFGGRGFKFDDTEEQLCVDRKKLQKAALGMHDSDDEDGGKDIDQQISDMFAEKKAIREVATPLVAPDALKNQKEAVGVVNKDKLAKAKELAAKLNITRKAPEDVDIMQQATSAVLKGDVKSLLNPMSGRNLAESLADKINAKLGYTAPVPSLMSLDVGLGVAEPIEGSTGGAPTATRYELELEINDFPQTARWRVTSREALNRISEFSEAGITVRGNYIPPGKEAKGEERKLYLAIESLNELAVDRAKLEIQRLIKEELVRLQNSYQPQSKGRYKLT